jgi:hypothetical protein
VWIFQIYHFGVERCEKEMDMTPFSFEWRWAADYYVFMGLLYTALGIIASGLVYSIVKTWLDVSKEEHGREEEIPQRSKYSTY